MSETTEIITNCPMCHESETDRGFLCTSCWKTVRKWADESVDGTFEGGRLLRCTDCGTLNVVPVGNSEFQCYVCSHYTLSAECKFCRHANFFSHVELMVNDSRRPGQSVDKQQIKCRHCGKSQRVGSMKNTPFAGSFVPKRSKNIYDKFGLSTDDVFAFQGRRSINGTYMFTSGASGLTSGPQTMIFDADAIRFTAGPNVWEQITYEDLQTIDIRGRGVTVTTSNLGLTGFGFGVKGAVEGIFWASVLNNASTVKKASVESIVGVEWQSGSLALLNRRLAPPELAEVLRVSMENIRKSSHSSAVAVLDTATSPSAVEDISVSLARLAKLRDAGDLTTEEFELAKRRLLG